MVTLLVMAMVVKCEYYGGSMVVVVVTLLVMVLGQYCKHGARLMIMS